MRARRSRRAKARRRPRTNGWASGFAWGRAIRHEPRRGPRSVADPGTSHAGPRGQAVVARHREPARPAADGRRSEVVPGRRPPAAERQARVLVVASREVPTGLIVDEVSVPPVRCGRLSRRGSPASSAASTISKEAIVAVPRCGRDSACSSCSRIRSSSRRARRRGLEAMTRSTHGRSVDAARHRARGRVARGRRLGVVDGSGTTRSTTAGSAS